MFPTPRQPGWGRVSVLGGVALAIVLARYWPREIASPPPAAPRPSGAVSRPRGLFAPIESSSVRRATLNSPLESSGAETTWRETISGRVVAPDGSSIGGAVLTLGKNVELSGPDGRFKILASSGRLRVTHPECFPREVEAEGAEAMSLVLVPGARVMGKITGPGGEAVAGARVQFGTTEEPPVAVTGPNGQYESPLLIHAPVCALVRHSGFQPQSKVLTLRGRIERWDVQLEGGDKLGILARDMVGEPLPDAEVWIAASGAGGDPSEWRFLGRTDDLGRIETRKEPRVLSTIRVSLAGYRDALAAAEPGDKDIQVRLRQVPALRGQAIDTATGLPVRISSMRLEALQGEKYVETLHRGLLFQSLEPGKFVVGLPPQAGTYRVQVRSQKSEDGARDLEGESEPVPFDGVSPVTPLVLRLEERIELHGVVLGPSGASPGIRIELLFDAPPESILGALDDGPERRWVVSGVKVPAPLRKLREGVTSDHGSFSFEGLSHGTYRLRARPAELDSFAEYLSAPFAVPWEGDFPVQLRRGALVSGTLHGPLDAPEPGVPVLLIHEEDWARVSRTDSSGRFEFRSVGPGDGYRLVVGSARDSDAGAGSIERKLTVEEGRDIAYDLRVEGTPSRELAGPVRAVAQEDDLAARPVEAVSRESGDDIDTATVGAEEPAGAGEAEPGAEPDPEPGAEPDARQEAAAPAAAERVPQKEKGNGGKLELQLVDAATQDKLARDAEVEVEEVDGSRLWRGRARGGTFSLSGLSPGRHRVRVKSQGLVLAEKELEVDGPVVARLAVEEPHDVLVQLRLADGTPFRGHATVVLEVGGRELSRQVEEIDETLTVHTPGPGEYEVHVESEDFESHMRVRVTREIEPREPH